jgi:putative CocE/NonD family hydrolase
MKYLSFVLLLQASLILHGQALNEDSVFIRTHYSKREVYISMRDGVRLFTSIYEPRDKSQKYPFLIQRTPYGCAPYGATKFPSRRLGPNRQLMQEQYIFIYQDVRGRYMSQGAFQEMTPAIDKKTSKKDVDESSDTYDTVNWLLKNISNNNGRVGIYGISYPGFYATASLPQAHPAIKAVSPQAPVTDEFIGDDANHKGAFFLMDNFDFMNYFDSHRMGPVQDYGKSLFNTDYTDAYKFFLDLGPLRNSNGPLYFNNQGKIWNEYLAHDNYDDYWQKRNIRSHLKNIKPAVLVVGGWFDAEDMFGALRTYESIEEQNPQNNNRLVMGPWTHGAWSRMEWTKFGSHDFGQNTSGFYRDEIETKFFNYYLKDKGALNLPEAYIFETGSNEWKKYDDWPPRNSTPLPFYLRENKKLSRSQAQSSGFDEYVSDPDNPVPYVEGAYRRRRNEYMVDDQRFASKRPDVLTYQTDTLAFPITISGKIFADLFVSTTGTDADFVVKLIDVLPADEPDPVPNPQNLNMAGYQRLVRAEVIRGKFRNSFEKPSPFTPGRIEEVKFELPDAAHTFKKGHRIMIQLQSSWFPLVDRNPQKYLNIPNAESGDFQKSTIKIYHEQEHSSKIFLPILNQ